MRIVLALLAVTVATPAAAAEVAPAITVYAGAAASAAAVRLCEQGCTITPQSAISRPVPARRAAPPRPMTAAAVEAAGERELDALLARLD